MEQRFEGTPSAVLNLARPPGDAQRGDQRLGPALQWEIRRNGQVVATANARADHAYEHPDATPGNYEVVLQMWNYVDYPKNPAGRIRQQPFHRCFQPRDLRSEFSVSVCSDSS